MQEFASEKVARHGTDAIHLLFGKGKSYQNQHSSGKGKSTYRAYVSYPDVDERSSSAWETMEETFETNFDEGNSHASLGDGFDEEEEQEQEFHYLEDEEEAITLNTILDLEEADDRQAGEAIQLQLAAFNAFSKAKGKGKGFGKKGLKG